MPPRAEADEVGGEIDPHGAVLVQLAWAGTAAFGVSAAGATAFGALQVVSVPVALLLFLGGTVAFTSAYLQALQRSREDAISVADLFFLTQCAPRSVRRAFMGALAAQLAIALVTASLRVYTGLAFGIMAPMWALGLAGLWGARHGTFPARDPGPAPRKASGPAPGKAPGKAPGGNDRATADPETGDGAHDG